jgi:hypothetical protein
MGQRYSDAEMLAELKRVAATVDGPLSRPKYIARSPRISAPAITARFGSWLAAIGRAGLTPAYRYGGMYRDCPACGASFRFEGGVKARITCGRRECSRKQRASKTFKGRAASKQAARGRGRKAVSVDLCNRCGRADSPTVRLEVHHRDRDPYNNEVQNLEVLCRLCHTAEHVAIRRLLRAPGVVAGFQPDGTPIPLSPEAP